MSKNDIGFEFALVDNSDLVKNATREKILRALELLGIQTQGRGKAKKLVDMRGECC